MVFIGVALGWVLDRHIERGILREAAEDTADHAQHLIAPYLQGQDFSAPLSRERYAELDRFFKEKVLSNRVVQVKLWNRQGLLVYSPERELVGRQFPVHGRLRAALRGETVAEISNLQESEHVAERGRFSQLIEIYSPVISRETGQIVGVYEIYQDASLVQSHLRSSRLALWGTLALGFVLLYASLFAIVRQASRTLVQQNVELRQLSERLGLSLQELEETYLGTLEALSAALDARDRETEGHSRRVTDLTLAVAKAMGFSEKQLVDIERGALLHDVGKIGISDAILHKPGPLTSEEWAEMRKHPELGYKVLQGIGFLQDALPIVLYHHEWYDGSGYPYGLRNGSIPLEARIFAVADAYDAITSERPYRPARSHEEALQEIKRHAGTQFDPQVVEVFLRVVDGYRR
jgi:HD-GYP domain-containing protein (c-di-GMP phosphodiesterase class II)